MRALPEYEIGGTTFIVDVQKEEFREKQNPANTIHFEMLIYNPDGYKLIYDPLVKNIPGPDRYRHADLQILDIPQITTLDAVGMAEKHQRPVSQVQGKSDFECIVDQELYQKRLSGVLPTLDVLGKTFYVDLRLGVIRPKDDFSTMGIPFSQMEALPLIVPNHYRFAYDRVSHRLAEIDLGTATELPKNIVVVEIPLQHRLDPLRYAQIHQMDEKPFLMSYPIQENLKARLVKWQETNLPQAIAANLRRANKQQEKPDEQDIKKAQHKRDRGKGL